MRYLRMLLFYYDTLHRRSRRSAITLAGRRSLRPNVLLLLMPKPARPAQASEGGFRFAMRREICAPGYLIGTRWKSRKKTSVRCLKRGTVRPSLFRHSKLLPSYRAQATVRGGARSRRYAENGAALNKLMSTRFPSSAVFVGICLLHEKEEVRTIVEWRRAEFNKEADQLANWITEGFGPTKCLHVPASTLSRNVLPEAPDAGREAERAYLQMKDSFGLPNGC